MKQNQNNIFYVQHIDICWYVFVSYVLVIRFKKGLSKYIRRTYVRRRDVGAQTRLKSTNGYRSESKFNSKLFHMSGWGYSLRRVFVACWPFVFANGLGHSSHFGSNNFSEGAPYANRINVRVDYFNAKFLEGKSIDFKLTKVQYHVLLTK